MALKGFVLRFHTDESGQDLLEYALVMAAVLTAVVSGSQAIANVIGTSLNTVMGKVTNAVQ